MKSPAERTVDVLVLVGSTVYATTALCCVYSMWTLRKKFSIALRSPLLGCWIGAAYTIRSYTETSYLLKGHNWSYTGDSKYTGIHAVIKIVLPPANFASVAAMIAWVIRLVVIYDPIKRKKWGWYVNEKRLFRGLVCLYVVVEAGALSSVGLNGAAWTASRMAVVDMVGVLATVAAAVLLARKMRNVRDICHLSSDIQHIGAVMMGIFVAVPAALHMPMPTLVFKYAVVSIGIAPYTIVGIIVVRPVGDYLQQHEYHDSRGGPLLLLLPWVWLWRRITTGPKNKASGSCGRVACTASTSDGTNQATLKPFGSSGTGHLGETPLAAVMNFLPLQQAFGEYCRKALCSESFQFLVDVSEFRRLVLEAPEAGEENGEADFDEFQAIINEYIKDRSSSEINISSTTKKKILGLCERSAYASLDPDGRKNVFLPAEKEIAKVLAENLLNKFKATTEYKELVGDMAFDAS